MVVDCGCRASRRRENIEVAAEAVETKVRVYRAHKLNFQNFGWPIRVKSHDHNIPCRCLRFKNIELWMSFLAKVTVQRNMRLRFDTTLSNWRKLSNLLISSCHDLSDVNLLTIHKERIFVFLYQQFESLSSKVGTSRKYQFQLVEETICQIWCTYRVVYAASPGKTHSSRGLQIEPLAYEKYSSTDAAYLNHILP